ncbi:TrmH family RNA methyltransferase [Promicromonospora sp. NPDC023805]|uniref:TrmH family RNA methyltransferase n=1 Tax=Promicromonospora sp. NPDC023805 TaxID=3154696 RepID=UPI0033D24E64
MPTTRERWSAPLSSYREEALARVDTPRGHEHQGVPDDVLADVDECVEIPMTGWGASLNVAVAGSLVVYRLAGLS